MATNYADLGSYSELVTAAKKSAKLYGVAKPGKLSHKRVLGDLSVNYSGSAFWQDVLGDAFHGTTEAYTMINGGVGVRWEDGKVTTSVKVVNLANQDVQQHVFGDILKRQVVGEMRVQF